MTAKKLLDEFEEVVREDVKEDSDSSNACVRVRYRRLLDFISDGTRSWVRTDRCKPDSEQTVLGCWLPNAVHAGVIYESIQFYALDSEVDGRDAWMLWNGEEGDEPDYWQPLPEPLRAFIECPTDELRLAWDAMLHITAASVPVVDMEGEVRALHPASVAKEPASMIVRPPSTAPEIDD